MLVGAWLVEVGAFCREFFVREEGFVFFFNGSVKKYFLCAVGPLSYCCKLRSSVCCCWTTVLGCVVCLFLTFGGMKGRSCFVNHLKTIRYF